MTEMPFLDAAGVPRDGQEGEVAEQRLPLSQFGLAARRFRRNWLAMSWLVVLGLLALITVGAPAVTPGVTADTDFTFSLLLGVNPAHYQPTLDHFPDGLLGYFGPSSPNEFANIVSLHGHSVLAAVTFGGRITLLIGIGAALLALIIGVAIGMISGYFGSALDEFLVRIADLVLSFPFLPLVIALLIAQNTQSATIGGIITIFSLTGWPAIARQVRAQFLVLREQSYTEAAVAAGVGDWRIMIRHLLPNALGPVLASFANLAASFILAEVVLDYILLGITNQATWGNAIAYAQYAIDAGNWWAIFFPGFFVVLATLALSFVAEGVREALNPRTHSR